MSKQPNGGQTRTSAGIALIPNTNNHRQVFRQKNWLCCSPVVCFLANILRILALGIPVMIQDELVNVCDPGRMWSQYIRSSLASICLYISKLKAVVVLIHGLCSPYFRLLEKCITSHNHFHQCFIFFISRMCMNILCVQEKLCINSLIEKN
jgi:hypothetical protein